PAAAVRALRERHGLARAGPGTVPRPPDRRGARGRAHPGSGVSPGRPVPVAHPPVAAREPAATHSLAPPAVGYTGRRAGGSSAAGLSASWRSGGASVPGYVLVVGDDPAMLAAIATAFGLQGIVCRTVLLGQDAVAM